MFYHLFVAYTHVPYKSSLPVPIRGGSEERIFSAHFSSDSCPFLVIFYIFIFLLVYKHFEPFFMSHKQLNVEIKHAVSNY
jgi:hypothetical protein